MYKTQTAHKTTNEYQTIEKSKAASFIAYYVIFIDTKRIQDEKIKSDTRWLMMMTMMVIKMRVSCDKIRKSFHKSVQTVSQASHKYTQTTHSFCSTNLLLITL